MNPPDRLNVPLWQAVSAAISQCLDNDFTPRALQPVHGGDISQAFIISGDAGDFFVKVNDRCCQPMFVAEQQALDKLQCYAPQAITVGAFDHWAYIVMSRLNIGAYGDEAALGRLVAHLHKNHIHSNNGQPCYGWDTDNYIGTTPQKNRWQRSWATFWVENRMCPQIALAVKQGYLRDENVLIDRFLNASGRLLAKHQPSSALLHGDLWRGNAGFDGDVPVIYDPASYYGDRETDLALTELFGGFSRAFYRGYEQAYPLEDGYQQRKLLYNIYHLLNHLNLFGEGYLHQVIFAMNQVISR